MTARHAGIVVAGLGIHGSAACYEIARRGHRVVGIDQFPAGHTLGSSHGATRMIRRAYPNPVWNPLVERAFAGWRRWECASGATLVHTTGGLYAHAGPAALQGPDCRVVDDPAELSRLMPGLAVPAGHHAVWDPAAGVLEASRALSVARDGATALGAELSRGERLLSWEARPDGVLVRTDRRELSARALVLAPGSWVAQAVPELAGLFEVWRIVTLTVRSGQPVAAPPSLGAFSVDRAGGLLFGIPDAGGHGFKVGVDAGPVCEPRTAPAPPTAAEIDHLAALMSDFVPGVDTALAEAASCLYTMTADRRFVVGALPWAPQVVLAAACSGHGFKFGPAIGEAVADLVDGRDRTDLDFIGVDRRVAA